MARFNHLKEFAERVQAFARSIPEQVNAVKQQTALTVLETLIRRTPVDTGEARTNWVVALGAPDRTTYRKGPYRKSGKQALLEGTAVINKSRITTAIHISNNAPHIGLLNAGRSSQAPAGFVEKAVADGRKRVSNAVIRFRPKVSLK